VAWPASAIIQLYAEIYVGILKHWPLSIFEVCRGGAAQERNDKVVDTASHMYPARPPVLTRTAQGAHAHC
jgi:hypothetical protein